MPSFVENVNKLANSIPDDFGSIISDIQSSISSLDSGKVDKIEGMVLSENSYTTTEKEKLSSLSNYTHPAKHPVSILDGNGNFSKFVKTDAIGGVGFDNVTWSDIQGKPSLFNPNAHQHTLSEISDAILKADKTYVDSGLATKANTTDVNNALALKADLSVVATDEELQSAITTLQHLSQKGQANGYVPLDAAGKIPNSYLNSLSTIDVYTASSQANMLLLSNVNVGDQCIRTDLASSNLFILTQTPATDINNWKQINTSASVLSVNGQTGVVNVSKADVGLGNVDNTADATKNVLSATKLTTSRTISLSGDATGSVSFDGSANANITVVIADNSHNHTLANISDFPSAVSATELEYLYGVTSNIQTQLDARPTTLKTINGASIVGSGDIVVGGGDMFKSTYDTTNNGIVDKAETADKLATARTIGGVSFDGTANINLPGVNTTGNQNTTGNAATATKLTTSSGDWSASGVIGNVVGMLAWKNYGNGHAIFDASNGTAPNGVAVNNTNSNSPWQPLYPTLMGWNGTQTYGVRVDSARVADSATTADNANKLIGKNWNWIGQGGQPTWVWGGSDGTNMWVYNPANFSVNYANTAGVANSATYATAFTTAVGSAPSYACRAWVNFNGTGTVAIRASGNVSSVTDNGTGNYTINFTTAMPDTYYSVCGMARDTDNDYHGIGIFRKLSDIKTTTQTQIETLYTSSWYDIPEVNVMIFR